MNTEQTTRWHRWTSEEDIAAHRAMWIEAGIPYGLCLCGCGAQTPLAKGTARAKRKIDGQPTRYVNAGHRNHKPVRYIVEDRGYTTPCWIWALSCNEEGYGHLNQYIGEGRCRSRPAHVATWEAQHGAVPKGLQLDHLCRVTSCVNPAHLEAVTNAVNVRRSSTAKLTEAQVRRIRRSLREGVARKALAANYRVSRATIQAIAEGRNWPGVE